MGAGKGWIGIDRVRTVAAVFAACMTVLAGCATQQGATLGPGTLMLGEVVGTLTPERVAAGEILAGTPWRDLKGSLAQRGITDVQVAQGRIVVLRYGLYWNNVASGVRRGIYSFERLADGLAVQPGNVVEVRVDDALSATVVARRAESLAAGRCYYGEVPVGMAVEVMGALSLVGPRGSASLYCAGIENEGWQRPRTYWHKPPAGTPTTGPAPAPPRRLPQDEGPSAELTDSALAMVTVRLRPPDAVFLHRLPVSVDERKLTALEAGQCDVLLVPAGSHVFEAGDDEPSLLRAGPAAAGPRSAAAHSTSQLQVTARTRPSNSSKTSVSRPPSA